MHYLDQLTLEGYATIRDLRKAGIKKVITDSTDKSTVIIDNNNNQWNYSSHDGAYILQATTDLKYLNQLE